MVSGPEPDRDDRVRPVVLVGLPGSGKSGVGAILAARLGRRFVDTDQVVEERCGRRIPDLVTRLGWAGFRSLETEALADAVNRKDVVVATGGGVVEDASNRHHLERATVVWLQARHAVLLARLEADGTARPLLEEAPAERLAELARKRDPLYAEVAGHAVATDGLSTEQVADAIMRILDAENG